LLGDFQGIGDIGSGEAVEAEGHHGAGFGV
jgi:hypothetical protein